MNTLTTTSQSSYRTAAILAGVLYIVGTVAGVLSGVVTGPVLDSPDYLRLASENSTLLIVGAFLVLLMGLSLAMVPVVLFPLLKKYNEVLATGYLIFRGALEAVTYLPWVFLWLLLVTLGRQYVEAGASAGAYYQTLGVLILRAGEWNSVIGCIIFSLGAFMFSYVLYASKLVPRWISIWGLLSAILYFVEPVLAAFGMKFEILFASMAFQEMALALWLIVKGFSVTSVKE